ncbi:MULTISPECIES: rhombosortase [unclassified Vibrio]|uniref:Rhombosortase n=1 Tax=Vibrio sp. HB236076 TaxID=3232307 RepID=A0AB39HC02_9VIBR|nr:rhombosortase [Vibrio sp. HB161653]MDP5253828.1 rhombosortase [Vibrio sp. HB161653]
MIIAFFFTLFSLIAQLPSIANELFWSHLLIAQGQWWRIITGNVIHTNITHWAMNISALWLMCFVFRWSPRQITLLLLSGACCVGLGLLLTDMQQYVGLSGVLHYLWAYSSANEWRRGQRSSSLLCLAIVLKVGWEQWYGASALTEQWIEASVAINAHLVGMVCGFALALFSHQGGTSGLYSVVKSMTKRQ